MIGKRTFSLVELLVVVTIIGIITGIVGLSLMSLSGTKLVEEAPKLANRFRWARDLAVVKSTNYTVDFDYNGDGAVNASDQEYFTIYETSNPDKIIFRKQIDVDSLSLKCNYIFECFDGSGYCDDNDPHLYNITNITNFTFLSSTGTVLDTDGDDLTLESIVAELNYRGHTEAVEVLSTTGYIIW